MSSDLVIVYHRQPYEEVVVDGVVERRANKSPNGIVPTLKSFFGRVGKGAWVAWKLAEDPANPDFEPVVEITDNFGTYNVSRLPLREDQVSSFYHVTSKEAFWPILHSFKDKYNYDPVDWPTFREVNWAFAVSVNGGFSSSSSSATSSSETSSSWTSADASRTCP